MGAASVMLHDDNAPSRAGRLQAEFDSRRREASKAHLIPPTAPGEQAEDRRPHGRSMRPIGQQPVMLDELLDERGPAILMEAQDARRQDAMTPFAKGQEHA
jgi:hypothetical protein